MLHRKSSNPLERQRGDHAKREHGCCIKPLSVGGGFAAISVPDNSAICPGPSWQFMALVPRVATFSRLVGTENLD